MLKALLTKDKPSEAKGAAKPSGKAPKPQETGNKEAKGTPAGPTSGQEEEPEVGTDPSGLPPMPPGHIHFKASDGSEHFVPHVNLAKWHRLTPESKFCEHPNGTTDNGKSFGGLTQMVVPAGAPPTPAAPPPPSFDHLTQFK